MSMGKELGAALRAARIEKGAKVREVAEYIGITPSAVSQWEAGTSEPGFARLQKAAEFLGINAFEIMMNSDHINEFNANAVIGSLVNNNIEHSEAPYTGLVRADSAPKFSSIVGLARDIPVLGNAVAGEDADFRLNGTETDRVIRPPGLADARGIFALYTVNDSMYPAWRENSLFYVNPHRRPAIGDDVVVEIISTEAGEPGAAFLKRLKARRDGKIIVEQFNPHREIAFDANAVRLYRVIPWDEALGLS